MSTKYNGKVGCGKIEKIEVSDKDKFVVSTKKGIVIRTGVKDIRVMGRATQGVRLINLKENDIIASVACVLVNEEEEAEEKGISEENNIIDEENGKEFDV